MQHLFHATYQFTLKLLLVIICFTNYPLAEDRMRKIARQLAAICPVYVLQVCYGMSGGLPAVATHQLAGSITREQESWIGDPVTTT